MSTRPRGIPQDAVEIAPGQWVTYDGTDEFGDPIVTCYCPSCGDPITGCRWGSRSECLRCYEHGLAPIPPEGTDDTGETWSDIYVGRGDHR